MSLYILSQFTFSPRDVGSTEKYLVPVGSRASSYAGNIGEGGYLTESSLSPSVASFLPNGVVNFRGAGGGGGVNDGAGVGLVDNDDSHSVVSQQPQQPQSSVQQQHQNCSSSIPNATKPKSNNHNNHVVNNSCSPIRYHQPSSTIRFPPTTPCSTDVNEESERERFLVNGEDEVDVVMLGAAGGRGGIHASSLPRKSTRRSRRTRNQMHFGGKKYVLLIIRPTQ